MDPRSALTEAMHTTPSQATASLLGDSLIAGPIAAVATAAITIAAAAIVACLASPRIKERHAMYNPCDGPTTMPAQDHDDTETSAIVEDWSAAAGHYSGHSRVRAVIQALAVNDARRGVAVPGALIVEE